MTKKNFLVMDLEGLHLTQVEKEMLLHPAVSGVILFSCNYHDKEQLKELVRNIKATRQDLLVAVDQEGGRVSRFKEGFTALPAFADFGVLYDKSPELAFREVDKYALIAAQELMGVGINVNFSPVLDLNWGESTVIGERSFHSDPKVVAELSSRYISAFNKCNIIAVAKHFPGHGGVKSDSHVDKVVDRREPHIALEKDLYPFKQAIANGITAIMTAHVIYTHLDVFAATFSKFWLKRVLRNQLGFTGTVFSDDLSMFAAEAVGDVETRVNLALEAGCDKILLCNDRKAVEEVLSHTNGDIHIDPNKPSFLELH